MFFFFTTKEIRKKKKTPNKIKTSRNSEEGIIQIHFWPTVEEPL